MTDREELLALRREVAELRREVAELRLAALYQAPQRLPQPPAVTRTYSTGPWWGNTCEGTPIQRYERRFADDVGRTPLHMALGGFQ